MRSTEASPNLQPFSGPGLSAGRHKTFCFCGRLRSANLRWHESVSNRLGADRRRPGGDRSLVKRRLRDGAAVAAVGEDQDSNSRGEPAEQFVDLVIDQFAVIEAPGLVLVVVLVLVPVGYLAP